MKRWILSVACLSALLVGIVGAYFYHSSFSSPFTRRGVMSDAWNPQEGPTTGDPTLWLLSIGVSKYRDPSLNLRFADVDAREIVDALALEKRGRIYKEIQSRLLVNAEVTRESILWAMTTFLNRAGPNDVAAIFLAGHGVRDGMTGSYYFMPHGATPDTLVTTGLQMSDFDVAIETLRRNVRRVVLMLDTCHSGAMQPDKRAIQTAADLAGRISKGEGLFVLAAAKPGEASHEETNLQNGIFTHSLLEALDGKADSDGDGLLKLSELFGYVADQVPRLTDGQQHPYQEMSGTDLVFASVMAGDDANGRAVQDSELAAPNEGNEELELFANRIAVLEFRNDRDKDEVNDWMGAALQTAFITELNKVEGLRVYSRDFLEEKAAGAATTLATARSVGAARAISGSFVAFGGAIRVDARIVDTESGLQQEAVNVDGRVEDFFNVEKQLVLNMLEALPELQVSDVDRASIAAENKSESSEAAVDALRLLLQGEGADPEDATEGKDAGGGTGPQPTTRDAGTSSLDANDPVFGIGLSWGVAHAQAPPKAEDEIRRTLEAYRIALQDADLDSISRLRGSLSERQRKGLEQYFQNADNLNIEFSGIEIKPLRDDVFAVSYVRKDTFADRRNGKTVDLEIQMETAVVREGDRWTMRSLGRQRN